VSSQVRQRLADAIHNGDLAPGTPLPAERSLCQEFGVARTSVREAIQGLVIAGFVERRGNRSVVSARLPDLHLPVLTSTATAAQLVEVRQALEPAIASLAAERATTDQRGEIAIIAAQPVTSIAELRRIDAQLHGALARACANPLLAELHAKTMVLLRGDVLALMHPAITSERGAEALAAASTACRAVADAVVLGDSVRAGRAEEAYLTALQQRMAAGID
jgi:GntR family transcriptional repressor for pyruvate dehydrogenase complex